MQAAAVEVLFLLFGVLMVAAATAALILFTTLLRKGWKDE